MSRAVSDLLFRPRSVVVYGASSDPAKLSGRPLHFLRRFGFAGELHAVNPHRDEVQGVVAYDDVIEVPGPIDLAIVVVPASSVLHALQRCADAGVGAAVVFASGFAEVGGVQQEAQEAMARIAVRSGMRILGPNCLGCFAARGGVVATFSTAFDLDEGMAPDSAVAMVSQSGAVGTFTYSAMASRRLGLRYLANTGNQCDVTVAELLTELAESEDVDVLLGHVEDLGDLGAIERLVRTAAERGKALALLKGGTTAAGAAALAAHTASDPGDDARFDDLLRRHGAARVTGMESMADAAIAFAAGRRPHGRRVTIVTMSGGAGALASDSAEERGLRVESWGDEESRRRIAELLPPYGSTANPIDLTGSMVNDVTILARTLQAVSDDDTTDATLLVLGNADNESAAIVDAIRTAYTADERPMLISWTGGSGRPGQELREAGIPVYPDPERAVAALGHLVRWGLGVPAEIEPGSVAG